MLLLSLAQSSAPSLPARVERRVAAMGTHFELSVEASERRLALAASEVAVRALESVEQRLSTWRGDSDLARFNAAPAGVPVEVSPELAADLRACRELWNASQGAFDPTVGALVRAWDLRGSGRLLDGAGVAQALASVGFDRGCIEQPDGRWVRGERVVLEEGGFGKGVGLDAALASLRAGSAIARLDLGGQVAVLGERVEWSIADPRQRASAVLAWSIESGSIATSGNSESRRDVEGTVLGHLIDPRDGRPAADFGSVSVWCAGATAADAFSTAAFVMGPQSAWSWARARADVELVLLVCDGERLSAHAEPELRDRVRVLSERVQLSFDGPRATNTERR
ncbi:MAG: FAD:protein FMN transferase [Planctomycetes bacterium]|nr:FAD:protein FMN transferase [Planctomycetota bacterium]